MFMKKIIVFCVSLFAVGVAANAASSMNGTSIESIEMSDMLRAEATVEPLDNELYLEVQAHINDYVAYLNATGVPISASKVNQWLAMNKKFFTNANLVMISENLKKLDEENYQSLLMLEYKNPTTSLLLSIFLGGLGVDRFYIGKVGAGVGKLLTLGGLGVWWLVDIFCIQNATRKVNYNEISEFMNMLVE